jgi:hypothetical protein
VVYLLLKQCILALTLLVLAQELLLSMDLTSMVAHIKIA